MHTPWQCVITAAGVSRWCVCVHVCVRVRQNKICIGTFPLIDLIVCISFAIESFYTFCFDDVDINSQIASLRRTNDYSNLRYTGKILFGILHSP